MQTSARRSTESLSRSVTVVAPAARIGTAGRGGALWSQALERLHFVASERQG